MITERRSCVDLPSGDSVLGHEYGLMTYSTDNLGDDIQSHATRALLPQVDHLIDRDRLAQFRAQDNVKVVCNGWFSHYPENWPPSSRIEPLLIAMHLNQGNSALGIPTAKYFCIPRTPNISRFTDPSALVIWRRSAFSNRQEFRPISPDASLSRCDRAASRSGTI
jgi:hypothetical protein